MLTASLDFQNALLASHLALVRVTALRRAADGSRAAVCRIPVTDGSLTIDGGADVWRTLSLDCPNETIPEVPGTVADIVTAWDTDLQVEFGVQFDWSWPDGGPSTEWVQVGRLRVDKVNVSRLGTSVSIDAADDGSRLSDHEIIIPWPAKIEGVLEDDLGRVVVSTIQKFVNDTYPATAQPTWVVAAGVDTAQTWPEGSKFQGSRWEQVRRLAEAIGVWVHSNAAGDWVIEPLPELGDPVLTLDEGQYGTLTRSEVEGDRTQTYNGIGVRYELPNEGSGLAFVYDTVLTSPTYWDGPFGRRSIVVDNDLVDNQTDAVAAAEKLLNQYRGRGQRIDVRAVWNPLLEPGDSVEIRTPTGVLETHIVDRIDYQIPLGEMSLTTRVVEVTA